MVFQREAWIIKAGQNCESEVTTEGELQISSKKLQLSRAWLASSWGVEGTCGDTLLQRPTNGFLSTFNHLFSWGFQIH